MRVRFPSPAPHSLAPIRNPSSRPLSPGGQRPIRKPCPSFVPVAYPIALWRHPSAGPRRTPAPCPRDRLIPLPGRMLVDQRGAGTGVPHTLHQLAQARARGSRHRVSRMPQVMQVQPGRARFVARLDQGGAAMRRRVRRSPRRALRWDARPARPRRPSHSSTTNLGGSIGSPGVECGARPSSSASIIPLAAAASRPPAAPSGSAPPSLDPAAAPQGFAPARTTGRTRCSVSTSSCRPRN